MLILASASPRRHDLLLAAGIDHIVRPASIPETLRPGERPLDFVRRLASEKAHAVASANPAAMVLGADTAVCVDEAVFGKPADLADARRMLRCLSGRDHLVHTGICFVSPQGQIVDSATTRVAVVSLTPEEIEEYVESGEALDKAGAYGIQGRFSKFVSSIHGCYQNVVGLPVSLVYSHWKELVKTYGSSTSTGA